MAPVAQTSGPSAFDLTPTLSSFLDPHLILQLLTFLQSQNVYDRANVLQLKIQVLQKTKLFDQLEAALKESGSTESASNIASQKQAVDERMKELEASIKDLLDHFSNYENIKDLRAAVQTQQQFGRSAAAVAAAAQQQQQQQLSGIAYMQQKQIEVDQTKLEQLYEYSRLEFDTGRYLQAGDHLLVYRLLSDKTEKCYMAQWGRVCALLLQRTEWEKIKLDVYELKDMIESAAMHDAVFRKNPLLVLQHRSWLLNWSLFSFFRDSNDKSDSSFDKCAMVDLFFNDKNLHAVQTNCPHLVRYLAVALMIAGRKRRIQFRELIKMIEQQQLAINKASDPIVRFVEALHVTADFDAAQRALVEIDQQLIGGDYFLRNYRAEILESARLLFFEIYSRIHRAVQINDIATRLALTGEEAAHADKWITEVLRKNKIPAKVDTDSKSIIVQEQQHSAQQQVLEKTDALSQRVNNLRAGIEKRLKQ